MIQQMMDRKEEKINEKMMLIVFKRCFEAFSRWGYRGKNQKNFDTI